MCSQSYNVLSARVDAGTYPSRQRDCVATASLSAETKGDASPLHTTPLPPLRGSSTKNRKSVKDKPASSRKAGLLFLVDKNGCIQGYEVIYPGCISFGYIAAAV